VLSEILLTEKPLSDRDHSDSIEHMAKGESLLPAVNPKFRLQIQKLVSKVAAVA
jgi:hypothetical protein